MIDLKQIRGGVALQNDVTALQTSYEGAKVQIAADSNSHLVASNLQVFAQTVMSSVTNNGQLIAGNGQELENIKNIFGTSVNNITTGTGKFDTTTLGTVTDLAWRSPVVGSSSDISEIINKISDNKENKGTENKSTVVGISAGSYQLYNAVDGLPLVTNNNVPVTLNVVVGAEGNTMSISGIPAIVSYDENGEAVYTEMSGEVSFKTFANYSAPFGIMVFNDPNFLVDGDEAHLATYANIINKLSNEIAQNESLIALIKSKIDLEALMQILKPELDKLSNQISGNTSSITTNTQNIASNLEKINGVTQSLASNIATVNESIKANEGNITKVSDQMKTVAPIVSQNTLQAEANKSNITTINNELESIKGNVTAMNGKVQSEVFSTDLTSTANQTVFEVNLNSFVTNPNKTYTGKLFAFYINGIKYNTTKYTVASANNKLTITWLNKDFTISADWDIAVQFTATTTESGSTLVNV